MKRDDLNKEIARYNTQIKKIKSVIPLITILSCASIVFFVKDIDKYPTNSLVGVVSILVFVSSFVYAYFMSKSKIKKFKRQLSQID